MKTYLNGLVFLYTCSKYQSDINHLPVRCILVIYRH